MVAIGDTGFQWPKGSAGDEMLASLLSGELTAFQMDVFVFHFNSFATGKDLQIHE